MYKTLTGTLDSRGRNFDQIVLKIGIHVGLTNAQIKFENELFGANRRGRTFPEKNYIVPRGRNIDSIFMKIGKLADIIKIINKLMENESCGVN